MSAIGTKRTSLFAPHMSAIGGKADVRNVHVLFLASLSCADRGAAGGDNVSWLLKVLKFTCNLLNHLERKKQSFESKLLRCLESPELPKLHTRVRFPSPAPSLGQSFTVSFTGYVRLPILAA